MEPGRLARAVVIRLDVSDIVEADEIALDALARIQLIARRSGATIEFCNARPALAALIACAGLADVLPVVEGRVGSGVEVDRQIEEREELRVDEEIHRGDGAA